MFFGFALLIVALGIWAYHHDQKLEHNAALVNIGDPNETVRELLGEPSREGDCGYITLAPRSCTEEYVYRYYFHIFRPQYEIVWLDRSGKVIGELYFQRP
jgi:hypothetical protein